MTCYFPLHGWRAKDGSGQVVFNRSLGYVDLPQDVPCRQCIGCRLDYSRQWAVRCVHHASFYENNCFITLTYRPEDLPSNGSLSKRHFQLFMKRLRKKFTPTMPKYIVDDEAKKEWRFRNCISYYHCGEYGELNFRPHYHASVFNFDFPDKVFLEKTELGHPLYTSKILDDLWGFGRCIIADFTYETAAYVARYVTKKVTGSKAKEHYARVCPETGEVTFLQPEYATMSNGIAREWFEKFHKDVYPDDFVVMGGKKVRPPRYYDDLLKHYDEDAFNTVKAARTAALANFSDNNTPERLLVRHEVKSLAINKLVRPLDLSL